MIDDHGACWQSIDPLGGQYSIGAAVESVSPSKAFLRQPSVQVAGTGRTRRSLGPGNGIPVVDVGTSSAEATGTVSRGECDRLVEEEDRCPRPGSVEWVLPAPVVEEAGDPRRATMMTGYPAPVVDQTAAVAGEQASLGDGMQIPPGVDAVTTGHRGTG